MDWGFLLVLAMLTVAGVFFMLALVYRTKPQVLKFTSYGLITLAILGLITLLFSESDDLRIAVFVFIALAIVYRWFYGGTLRDRDVN
ncbi:MAG: hypothetical protein Q7S43_03060 [bacterium]|nr:hypothetical protein [bacterium]MDO8496408.1 hypothetical protein [bacterium]